MKGYKTYKNVKNKEIAKEKGKGILKIAVAYLPALMAVLVLTTGVGLSVDAMVYNKKIRDFKQSETFTVVQAEDLAHLSEQYNNGEIEQSKYIEGVEYLKSDEYFKKVMESNEEYQKLNQKLKIFGGMGIGFLVGGFVGLVAAMLAKSGNFSKLNLMFNEGISDIVNADELKKKMNEPAFEEISDKFVLPESKTEEEEIQDLDDEFYKKD